MPRQLLLAVAAFALLTFAECGMAIRVDVECPLATDGEPNPHAHAYLAMRTVDQSGFGLKERAWNDLFWRDGGCHVRAIIAARLTLACAVLGIDAYVDPRRNEARGAGTPEDRVPPLLFRLHDAGQQVEEIEQLKARRLQKKASKAPQKAPEATSGLVITNAGAYDDDDEEKAAEFRERFSDVALQAGYQLETFPAEAAGLSRLSLAGTSVSFDGRTFRLKDACTAEDAAIVARFARNLDWPALVVEGEAPLADLMAIAAASVDLFMVNRSPSAEARDVISRAHFETFKMALARHDPLGRVTKSLADFAPGSALASSGEDVEEIAPSPATSNVDFELATVGILSDEFPVQPSVAMVAEPDPDVATAQATSGASSPGYSTTDQMIVSSAPPVDELETLPDDDSWQIKPNPKTVAQNDRYMQDYRDRIQRQAEEVEEIVRRMSDRLLRKNPRLP